MTLTVEMITFDCDDPDELAGWWAGVLDGTVNPLMAGEFVVVVCADGPNLGFQKVDDPTPGKNRLHIDFHGADMESEVERLVGLGATETDRHDLGEDFRWVVLTDPEGNAFCVGG
jgi:hypothetical protein